MRFRESGGTSGRGTWVARWNDNWRCVLGKIPWERGGVGREAQGIGQGQGGAPFPDGEAGVRRYAKIRYRGPAKNTERLALLFGLGNLLTAEGQLAGWRGCSGPIHGRRPLDGPVNPQGPRWSEMAGWNIGNTGHENREISSELPCDPPGNPSPLLFRVSLSKCVLARATCSSPASPAGDGATWR